MWDDPAKVDIICLTSFVVSKLMTSGMLVGGTPCSTRLDASTRDLTRKDLCPMYSSPQSRRFDCLAGFLPSLAAFAFSARAMASAVTCLGVSSCHSRVVSRIARMAPVAESACAPQTTQRHSRFR